MKSGDQITLHSSGESKEYTVTAVKTYEDENMEPIEIPLPPHVYPDDVRKDKSRYSPWTIASVLQREERERRRKNRKK